MGYHLVIYLTGVSNKETRELAQTRTDIGLMIQPGNGLWRQIEAYPVFAMDNACYGGRFNAYKYLTMMDRIASYQERCLFVVAPDRFDPADLGGNHAATLQLWEEWWEEIAGRGLAPAFVCQNGSTPDDVPDQAGAVFIGGDTTWKLSRWAWAQVAAARARGRWAHVGRVNTVVRWGSVNIFGADSCDGTLIRHGPRAEMVRQLTRMLDQPAQLPLTCA